MAEHRQLLPYQKSLAEALGVSEEDLLELDALQRDPAMDPALRASELRMDPTVIGIALMVVGTIFQVVGALLMTPPPQKSRSGKRSETFAPRYGFSASQELARYGDPVNVVYTNREQNPNGSVRVATSLLWSSIESFGTTQYLQMLLLVGAAQVRRINFQRSAFGQLPFRDMGEHNLWVYYNEAGGPVRFRDSKVLGLKGDPARENADPDGVVHRIRRGNGWTQGFSQAFSPASMTACGAWAPIPINVEWMERGSLGAPKWKDLGIRLKGGSWGEGGRYRRGDRITLEFDRVERKKKGLAVEAARDAREAMVSNLDVGSTYLLGSAQFRLASITTNVNLQENRVEATLECIEGGRQPTPRYSRTRARKGLGDKIEEQVRDAVQILKAPAAAVTVADNGRSARYDAIEVTSEVLDGAAERPRRLAWMPSGEIEPALGEDADQKRDEELAMSMGLGNVKFSAHGIEWDFSGKDTIQWTNDLDQRKSFTFPRSGSIKSTEGLLAAVLADPPKLSTAQLKQEYRSDLESARRLRDDINAGEMDRKFREDARALNEAIKTVAAELDRRIQERIDAENAFESENDSIRDIDKAIDDLNEQIEEERNSSSPNAEKIKRWKARRAELRDEKRERKRKREQGDSSKKSSSEIRMKELREIKADLESNEIAERKRAYVRFIREATEPFEGIDGNRYAGGINQLTRLMDSLQGEFTVDQTGASAITEALTKLIADKSQALRDGRWLARNWETLEKDVDDAFFCKVLTKMEEATYQTVTGCNLVKINLRVRVWRRISGRDKNYGEAEAPDGYRRSDNGFKRRMMFFTVRYRETESDKWIMVPTIFCVQRGANQDNFVCVEFEPATKELEKWTFKVSPVIDPPAEFQENGQKDYTFVENAGQRRHVEVEAGTFSVRGNRVARDWNLFPALEERGPIHTNEWDLFSNRSDSQLEGSFQDGPEIVITSVTEQQRAPITGLYQNMSLMAMHLFAGRGVQDVRSVTAEVVEGKDAWIVTTGENPGPLKTDRSTSWAPDIFVDSVLSKVDGMGTIARPECLQWESLALSKRFCQNNGLGTQLFMDGVFADQGNWRETWERIAPWSLLEFARIGGRDTLVPAIPCNDAGVADRRVNIVAAFNSGNIMPGTLRQSFLDYGDSTRDLVGTAIYRDFRRKEVFSRNTSITLHLNDADLADATYTTFDLSDWVTNRQQAELYLRLLCRQRRLLRRACEFQTIPTDSMILPGSYVVIDTGKTTWDRITSGVVDQGGELNLPLRTGLMNGTHNALLYRSGRKPISLAGIEVAGGSAPALAPYTGWLVVLGTLSSSKAVWRIGNVEISREGVVTVQATEHPVTGPDNHLLSRVADLAPEGFKLAGLDSF